jgi:hypothetical protein
MKIEKDLKIEKIGQCPNFDCAFLCDLCEPFAFFAVKGFVPEIARLARFLYQTDHNRSLTMRGRLLRGCYHKDSFVIS